MGWQSNQLDDMQFICTLLQTTMPVPHHSAFYGPDALPAAQASASKHWRCIHQHYTLTNKCSTVAEMRDRLAITDMGQKEGRLLCSFRGGAGPPSNTMSYGTRPTSIPGGILITAAVLATMDMGRKLGRGLWPLFWEGELATFDKYLTVTRKW